MLRGGAAYDTAAARPGFLRASFDGAARVTAALGGSYRTRRWELNAGAGLVLEPRQTNPGASPDGSDCNPTRMMPFCPGTTGPRPLDERGGPDPTNPLLTPENQFENPFTQGSIEGRYLMFMLGGSTCFDRAGAPAGCLGSPRLPARFARGAAGSPEFCSHEASSIIVRSAAAYTLTSHSDTSAHGTRGERRNPRAALQAYGSQESLPRKEGDVSMMAIKNILATMGIAFFVASCGLGGEQTEADEQELEATLEEICAASSEEDCAASYEALYDEYEARATTSCGRCKAQCRKRCKPPNRPPECENSCDAQCKQECSKNIVDSPDGLDSLASLDSSADYSYGNDNKCEKKCEKRCEKKCKYGNPGCLPSCKAHCKNRCRKDHKDHASFLEVN